MEKTIQDLEARENFAGLLEAVLAEGDRFVVERDGEAVAALVPIEVYRQWERFGIFDIMHANNEGSEILYLLIFPIII